MAEKNNRHVEQRRRRGPGPGGPGGHGMMPGEKATDFGGTMKKLLRYLRPHSFKLAVVFIFAIVSTVFSIVSPTILGDATDTIVEGLMSPLGIDFSALLDTIILLICLYAISFVFSFSQSYIMAGVSQKVTYELREKMSQKIDSLPVSYFDNRTHGQIQSYMINDIETINQSLSQSISQIITSATMIVGILIMMIRINLLMTITALIVLPLSALAIKLIVSRSQVQFRKQQDDLSDVNGHVEEMFDGHTVIKAFNREEDSIEKFDEINDALYSSSWKSQFLSGMMMPITNFIGNLGYVAVCILGGYLAINGSVSIGNIQSFIQYVRSFNQPLSQVSQAANLLQSTAAAAERVFGKLTTINAEYLKWFELLIAMVLAILGYMAPILLLKFQVKMRQMEMENEVMQFQTIILMLMRIERVNVEIILEWLERYSNIFREPINKCVNNYESGPWEALEQMKEDVGGGVSAANVSSNFSGFVPERMVGMVDLIDHEAVDSLKKEPQPLPEKVFNRIEDITIDDLCED